MKKFLIALMAVVLITAVAFGIAACSDNEEDIPDDDIESELYPGEALWSVVEKISSSKNINVSDAMNVVFGGKAEFNNKGKKNNLSFNGEINASGGLKDMFLDIKDDGKELFGVYMDGTDMYLSLNEIGYKYVDVLGKNTGGNKGELPEGRVSLDAESIVTLLGEILFYDVKQIDDSYVFYFNLGKVADSYLDMILSLAGIDGAEFAGFLGYGDVQSMIEAWSRVSAEAEFRFKGDRFGGASLRYKNTDSAKIELNKFDIIKGNSTIDYNTVIPEQDYIETNAVNFNLNGNMELKDESDGKIIAKYGWRMVADMNPFRPDDKDKFHFVMTNKLSDNTVEYNSEKIAPKDGVVLELAYSPEEFGTTNILAAINLKSILDKSILTNLGVSAELGKLLPNYFGTHIDIAALLSMDAVGSVKSYNSRQTTLSDVLGLISLKKGSLTLDRKLIDMIFGSGGEIGDMLDTSSNKTDKITLNVDFMNYGADNGDYVMKEHFMTVADDDGSTKSFGLGNKPSKDAWVNSDNGFVRLTTAYGKTVNDGVNYISPTELRTLIGGKVNYSYTAFNGSTNDAKKPVEIMGIKGADLNKTGEEQTISLITSMPDGDNLIALLDSLNVNLRLPTNVFKTKIILTKEDKAAITDLNNVTEYKIGDVLKFDKSDLKLDIAYDNGAEYSYIASSYSHNIPTQDGVISEAGKYAVYYDIGGRQYTREVTVAKPDSVNITLNDYLGRKGENVSEVLGSVKVVYGDEIKNLRLTKDMVKFPGGAVTNNIFTASGDYFVRVGAYGANKVLRAKVLPEYSRYTLEASGNKDALNVNAKISKLGEIGARAKLKIVQEKSILGLWVKDKDINGNVGGVSLGEYVADIPYMSGVVITVSDNDITAGSNYRITVGLYSVSDNIKLAETTVQLS